MAKFLVYSLSYAELDVRQEVGELFQYIARYKPHAIELETKMRPFVAHS